MNDIPGHKKHKNKAHNTRISFNQTFLSRKTLRSPTAASKEKEKIPAFFPPAEEKLPKEEVSEADSKKELSEKHEEIEKAAEIPMRSPGTVSEFDLENSPPEPEESENAPRKKPSMQIIRKPSNDPEEQKAKVTFENPSPAPRSSCPTILPSQKKKEEPKVPDYRSSVSVLQQANYYDTKLQGKFLPPKN